MAKFHSIFLGHTKDGDPVYVDPKTRSTHMHIIGGTGRGKSKLMEHMIREDILNEHGLCLIDPHGQLYDDLVTWCEAIGILKTRKILLFEPTEENWSFAFNPLKATSSELSYHVDSLTKAIAKVWGSEDTDQTPLFERCITSILWLLIEQNRPLLDARYLIDRIDSRVREHLARQIKNPDIKQEWDYFNTLKPRLFSEEFASTINRMNRFLRSPTIRTIIGQTEHTIDFKKIMDEGHVLLVNFATRGKMSLEESNLLGTLFINDLFMKALERPKDSPPFYLYIDECARYLNDDIEHILDETRKFGLHVILAHQRLGQLEKAGSAIYDAVMSIQNKAILGGIRVEEAKKLAEQTFIGELKLEEAKKGLYKPTVVGYDRTILESHAQAAGRTHGRSSASSRGTSTIHGQAQGETARPSPDLFGEDPVIAISQVQSSAEGSVSTESEGEFTALSESESWGWVQALLPIIEWLPDKIYSLEEQIYRATAKMVRQPEQHTIIKLGEKQTKFVKVPTVKQADSKQEWIGKFKEKCYNLAEPPFVKPKELVREQIDQRLLALEREAKEAGYPEDPKSYLE